MLLYVIRHAWAGYYGDPKWPDDSQRPLTEQGRARFCRVVELLTDRGFTPQIVATSPFIRCRETADIVAQVCPSHPDVVALDDLAPGGDMAGLLRWTVDQTSQYDQIAWVGHAPDVGYLTAALIGNRDSWMRFAKGAVAAVEFEQPPKFSEGELRWLTTAKILGC